MGEHKQPHRPTARRILRTAFMALIMPALLCGTAIWFCCSAGGLLVGAALLERASNGAIRIEGVRGRLIGPLEAARLEIADGERGGRLVVEELSLAWNPSALIDGLLEIHNLRATIVRLPPSSGETPTLPVDLRLPVAVRIHAIDIDAIHATGSGSGSSNDPALLGALHAAFVSDGVNHELKSLEARVSAGRLSGGATLRGLAPFELSATAAFEGGVTAQPPLPPLRLRARAEGTLAALRVAIVGAPADEKNNVSLSGELRLKPFAAQPLEALHLDARNLDPRVLRSDAPHAALTFTTDLAPNDDGALAGSIRLSNARPGPLDRAALPLTQASANVLLALGENPRRLRIDDLLLKAGRGAMTGRIDLSWPTDDAALPRGQADLRVRSLDPAAWHSALRPARLAGSITLTGDTQTQSASLSLDDGPRRLDAELRFQDDILSVARVALRQGSAELSGSGELNLQAPRRWRFTGELRHFNPAAFAALPTADLNARIETSGSLLPNSAGQLRFDLTQSRIAGQSLSARGELSFAGIERPADLIAANGRAHVRGTLAAALDASRLDAHGGWGGPTDKLRLHLQAPDLARHRALAPELGVLSGALDLHLDAAPGGPATPPEIRLEAHGRDIALPGDVRLGVLDVNAGLHDDALKGRVAVTALRHEKRAMLERVELTLDGTRSRHRLRLTATDAGRMLELAAGGALSAPPPDWRDTTWTGAIDRLKFSTAANPPLPEALAQTLTLNAPARLAASRRKVALDATTLAFADGRIELTETVWSPDGWRSRGRFRDLALGAGLAAAAAAASASAANDAAPRAAGEWSLAENQAGLLAGRLRANVPDLRGLGALLGAGLTAGGTLEVDMELAGSRAAPALRGRLDGSRLAIGIPEHNLQLRDGALALRFEGERAIIERLTFSAPHAPPARALAETGYKAPSEPGRIEISGEFDVTGQRTHLAARLSSLPLMQQPDRWLVASGTATLEQDFRRLRLGARLIADAGFIGGLAAGQPRLADDVVVRGREPRAQRGPAIEMDVVLDLGKRFRLRSAGLAARLEGQLHVRGNPLAATGSIAAQDGTYEAYGQRLVVERGIVNFQGPLENPGLNVLALRKGGAVEAGVAITGTAQRPVVRLVSTPAVPDAEKLSWIVLGRPPDAGGADAGLLLAAAGTILGGEGEALTTQIARTFGFDELTLRNAQNGAQNGAALDSQIVSLGKRLSRRAYLSYEQGLSATTGALKLTYTLTRRISVVTRTGEDNAVDVFYNFDFD